MRIIWRLRGYYALRGKRYTLGPAKNAASRAAVRMALPGIAPERFRALPLRVMRVELARGAGYHLRVSFASSRKRTAGHEFSSTGYAREKDCPADSHHFGSRYGAQKVGAATKLTNPGCSGRVVVPRRFVARYLLSRQAGRPRGGIWGAPSQSWLKSGGNPNQERGAKPPKFGRV